MSKAIGNRGFITSAVVLAVAETVLRGTFRLDAPLFTAGALAAALAILAVPGALLGGGAWYAVSAFRKAAEPLNWRWFVLGAMAVLILLGQTAPPLAGSP
jgi:hypothetical protein